MLPVPNTSIVCVDDVVILHSAQEPASGLADLRAPVLRGGLPPHQPHARAPHGRGLQVGDLPPDDHRGVGRGLLLPPGLIEEYTPHGFIEC